MKLFYIKLLSVLAILSLGIAVYSNTFFSPFHFDDIHFIVDNYFIRNFHHLADIWKFYPGRFVLFFSFILNYHFNQLDVFGYHLFNLGVHLLSAILVWWLVLLTLSTPEMKKSTIAEHANLVALLAALVFVSHPVQTEAVTYIWQRAASLVTLFYLASLCFYVRARLFQDSVTIIYYISSLILAVMAMFTKENAITLPLMILLYESIFLKGKKKVNWAYIIPFFLTLIIIPLTIFVSEADRIHDMQTIAHGPEGISPLHYLLTQFRVMMTYIRLVFVPINLNLDYDFPVYKGLFEIPVFASLLFLIAVFYFTKRLFLKYRVVSFSILWFFLTLLPESSLMPLHDVIFEHRLYLPLVGFSLFLVSGAYYLFGKNNVKWMVIALTLIIACNSFLTYQRNNVWRDDFTLWQDTVLKSPHKARPYNGRGLCYYKQGKIAQAMSDYSKAIEIDPNYIEAYSNRGVIYINQGDFTKAIADYDKAIEINPSDLEAYNNRGSAYYRLGNFTQALLDYKRVIELNAFYSDAYSNRAGVYDKMGNFSQAIADYNKTIDLNPNNAEGYLNRGLVYEQEGQLEQSIADLNKAIEINPVFSESYFNLGLISYKQGNFAQALLDYNKAIEINPGYAESYNNRGSTYEQLGKSAQALLDYNKAIEINPNYAGAYSNRGYNYESQGNLPQAIADLNKAIKINPDYMDPYINRGNAYAKQNNFTQAIDDYTKAIELSPQSRMAFQNRAILYYQLKEYAKAWEDVHNLEKLGAAINPVLINALKQASGRLINLEIILF